VEGDLTLKREVTLRMGWWGIAGSESDQALVPLLQLIYKRMRVLDFGGARITRGVHFQPCKTGLKGVERLSATAKEKGRGVHVGKPKQTEKVGGVKGHNKSHFKKGGGEGDRALPWEAKS